MYVKLAITNAKKSIKDYLIYFITITLCVSLFYAFISLSSSNYELITEESYNFEMLQNILKYSTYVITTVLVVLIGYVNKYMMKRRQREFATYILLGTEQKNVALMFFIETLIIGILAIILGIVVGTLFSQVVTALVLLTAKQDIIFNFRLYMDTVVITFVFFLSMFCIIGLYNVKVLKKLKLINMMYAEKKSEFQFKRNEKVYGFIFIVSIVLYSICGYCTYTLIQAVGNDSKVAGSKPVFIMLALVSFIIATYSLFYSLAFIIIYIKEKWINFKYEGSNLFLMGSIVSKIKTAPILMATISITFLGAAISFIVTLIISQWSLGYLDYRIPFDISISNEYNVPRYFNITDINDIPNINYGEVVNYLKGNDNNIKEYCILEKYFINRDDFYIKEKEDRPILAISLSDFNKLRRMLGYEEVQLNDNEFTTQWQRTSSKEIVDKFISLNSILKIEGKEFKISDVPFYIESIGESSYNLYTDALIVLPDKICNELILAGTDFYANIKKQMSHDKAVIFENEYIQTWINKNYKNLINKYNIDKDDNSSYFIYTNIKALEESEILNITLAMRILGIYLGVVLLMISLTVLALQQLVDSIEHKKRFNVLRKLGVDERDISKIVLKQISIYFIIPISIAMIGVIVFIYNFLSLYSVEIISYIGNKAAIFNIIVAIILIISIYICYFIATYYTFKINIKEQ
ncbi:FtsX-like permease family protein [Clostridium mediterraneense]|uniref:FtsX-like permease family protein n=1 Tax=Clostridium mediterraneense TaxID=1805472 RepID=UPI000830646C|nr:FtsX-like permease family protein [Clostridium mediterraneense]